MSATGGAKLTPIRLRSFLDKSNIWTRNIHGECRLPEGYNVAMLPSNATLVSSSHQDPKNISISCSHSIPKIVVAIVQATYASITVYRSRGDQTDRFGYAAFGFTVLPYIVMSLVNLLGSLLLPDYPTLYIVHSLESDEATLLGGTVDGAVGRLVQRKDVYLNFLHDSSVREEDGEQYSNSIDGGDVTADHSMRTGSRQSHNEENSPRLRLPQEAESAGFTASVIASPLSSAFDMNNNANYEQHRDNQEEAHDSVPQEEGPSKILLTGDDEDITYRSATHVKRLKSNPPDQHSHYTPFATNGDTEGWPNNIIVSHNVMLLFAPAIPLGVIGGMTHFHKGHSTTGQRAWTMTWLALNGLLSPMFEEVFDPSQADSGTIKNGVDVVRLIVVKSVFAVPAIGGFVTVGQMVREYGSCTVLDGL